MTTEMIPQTTAMAQAAARELAEVSTAMQAARDYPRDEDSARKRVMSACRRASFAADALYSFPRGGTPISGPSVKLAREAGRCWGNVRYGFRVVERRGDQVTIEGYAVDLESNTRVAVEGTFRWMVQRKRDGKTVWIEPDERDGRELLAKHGAVAERNAILKLLPSDLVEEAVEEVRKTQAAEAEAERKAGEVVKKIVTAFGEQKVSRADLERRFGPLDKLIGDQLAELRRILASLRSGEVKWADYLEGEPTEPTPEPSPSTPAPANDGGI
jgi:hypothetical protein